ncbi:hypothetical protein Fmac_021420 [Flemingia macrophylla]|uniref:Uncharacterized protein n=1 Tax=Flemingia macrophylla TaxID=520843 RepID=A0ABD1LXA8_9FABA
MQTQTVPLAWTPRSTHNLISPQKTAVVSSSLLKGQKSHSMSQEKLEIFKSLEGWVSRQVLPLLKPVEQSWQPQSFVPNSSLPFEEFKDQLKALRDRTKELPDEYLVVLVGDMITEEALPTYHAILEQLRWGERGLRRKPKPVG